MEEVKELLYQHMLKNIKSFVKDNKEFLEYGTDYTDDYLSDVLENKDQEEQKSVFLKALPKLESQINLVRLKDFPFSLFLLLTLLVPGTKV